MVAPAAARPVTSSVRLSPGLGALDAAMGAPAVFCSPAIAGGVETSVITTGEALVVPLLSLRIAIPGLSAGGTTKVT